MKQTIILTISGLILLGCSDSSQIENFADAQKQLNYLIENSVQPSRVENEYRANIELSSTNLLELLPDINEYTRTVDVQDSDKIEAVEIFTSSEKAGLGRDGLYTDLAKSFNRKQFKLPNGKVGQISIRNIASGAAASFLMASQHVPDAYSPSHVLWGKMLMSQGIKLDELAAKTAPNVTGILVRKGKSDLITTDGKLDVQKLLTAVTSGQFSMGYANPYQSSTGLNFLLLVLNAFAQGDESQMLEPDVVSAFEAFQRGIPFVASNTLQIREATVNSGVLDGFVMEYQTY